MRPKTVMVIAGEASGDALAGELVRALSQTIPQAKFFGAGGPKMAEAGVEIIFETTIESIIGPSPKAFRLIKVFRGLLDEAIKRQPELIVLVDFGLFNRWFAHAVRKKLRDGEGTSSNWHPKIVQFVSPQVWASRPGRAQKIAREMDLLLCLFPFEKEWYAKRVPGFHVEFVGHPMFDRYAVGTRSSASQTLSITDEKKVRDAVERIPTVVLLPGSRSGELKRHLPAMIEAAKKIAAQKNVRFKMVLPNEQMKQLANELGAVLPNLEIQIGGLAPALAEATIALASTGTVTLECAYFGVPTIAFYKTSWLTFQIGKRIVQVKFLAMPNLLADEAVFPEFIQHEVTAENLTRAALDLLNNPARCDEIKSKLQKIMQSLGGPGASRRAAEAIVKLTGGV